MAIHLHVTGELVHDPQRCTSAKGNDFATGSVRSGSGDEAVFVNLVAFGDTAERLLQLHKGDAVSVAGRGELNRWTAKDGTEKTGLSVVANEIAAARPRPRQRDAAPHQERPTPRPPYDGPPLDDPIDNIYAEAER